MPCCLFLQCIKAWTQQQREHPPQDGSANYTCPLCKQRYTHIIHDCVLDSFRYMNHPVHDPAFSWEVERVAHA